MKINELIDSFEIYITNEEAELMPRLEDPVPLSTFNEREQFIIGNMIKKSLVSKVRHNDLYLVMRNA